MQEVKQIVGILSSRIETDEEVEGALVLDQVFEALAEQGIAGGGLGRRGR